MDTLCFDNIPSRWEDGLPFGNGRLAAMLWGDCTKDIISLNHEDLWTGNFKHRECEVGAHFLPYVREYLSKGQNFKATALSAVAFGGNGGISPLVRRMDSFQPACDIILSHDPVPSCRRSVNMSTGIVASQKSSLSLRAFCHCIEDYLVCEWHSIIPISCQLSVCREPQEGVSFRYEVLQDTLQLVVDAGNGVDYIVRMNLQTDGRFIPLVNGYLIEDASNIVVMVDVGSELRRMYEELSLHQFGKDVDKLAATQAKAFHLAMPSCVMDIADDETSTLEHMTINRRVERLAQGCSDAQLVSLYARFGAYLMVSGSILARLPLHLQGKWNHSIFPKWNSDYHLNINLQMNYWCTDALQLDECTKLMIEYVQSLVPKARIAAKRMYDCNGIVFPLNSDIWRNVTAESYNYSVWISGAGWFCLHLWNHFLHNGDMDYLRTVAFPFFQEVATFYEDYIEFDETGVAQIMPSQSPENRYEGCGYFPVSMCISSAMDVQIASTALDIAVQSARILNLDPKIYSPWQQILGNLPPFRIGKDGRLLEWDSEDKLEIEPGHRHFSHLFGVYPGNLFSPEWNIQQYDASKRSLEYRLAHSGGHTGWSRAWSACLFARFQDPEQVANSFSTLIASLSSSSLLCLHPDYYPQKKHGNKPKDDPLLFAPAQKNPPMIFQIDGNLGGTAAFLEAFVQCRNGVLFLMVAVPEQWRRGTIGPVRIQGGHLVSFSFDHGQVTKLKVVIGYARQVVIAGFGTDKSDLLIEGDMGDTIVVR